MAKKKKERIFIYHCDGEWFVKESKKTKIPVTILVNKLIKEYEKTRKKRKRKNAFGFEMGDFDIKV